MRTPGSRPAVGRRQIVADKSSKRGITSAQPEVPSVFRPSLSLANFYPSISVHPCRIVLRFASPRSLLFLFLPFFPCSSFPPFSIRCVIFEAQGTRSSPEPGERVGRWFTVSSLFPSPLYPRGRGRESPGPSPPPYLADLSSWFRQSIYEPRGRPVHALPLLFCSSALLLVRSLARSLSFRRLLTCLRLLAGCSWKVNSQPWQRLAGVPARHRCTASPGRWLNDRDRRVENEQPGKTTTRCKLSIELWPGTRRADHLLLRVFLELDASFAEESSDPLCAWAVRIRGRRPCIRVYRSRYWQRYRHCFCPSNRFPLCQQLRYFESVNGSYRGERNFHEEKTRKDVFFVEERLCFYLLVSLYFIIR